jgi:hypothetical protein
VARGRSEVRQLYSTSDDFKRAHTKHRTTPAIGRRQALSGWPRVQQADQPIAPFATSSYHHQYIHPTFRASHGNGMYLRLPEEICVLIYTTNWASESEPTVPASVRASFACTSRIATTPSTCTIPVRGRRRSAKDGYYLDSGTISVPSASDHVF